MPTLVPKEHFVNAVTWGASIFQMANAFGPMIGGLLFTIALTGRPPLRFNGAPLVYTFTCHLPGRDSSWSLCLLVHPRGAAEKKGFTIDTMLAGLRYVIGTRLLLGSISLDLFAVLLGGAVSLLPIFAHPTSCTAERMPSACLRAMPSIGALRGLAHA